MAVKISINGTIEVAKGIWTTQVPPEELKLISGARSALSNLSIVFLPGLGTPSTESNRLEFDVAQAQLLNLGRSDNTLVIYGDALQAPQIAELSTQSFGPRVQHDDATFLSEVRELPPELAEAGRKLLAAMRLEFEGGYFQRTPSGRYVNRPTNFFAVKIQPRDVSYSIIVRGMPHEYRTLADELEIKEDQRGYSRFKLSDPRNLDAVLRILRHAGKR